MHSKESKIQKGLIITDDVAVNPILDFDQYRDAVVNIIMNSYPKFTIGIFGEWGTGKSTLLDSIDNKLSMKNKDLVIVRFDTWRYEREPQFALIPLLKTIEFAIPEKRYKNLKEAVRKAGLFGLKTSTDLISDLVSIHLGNTAGDLTKKGLNELNSKIIPELIKVNSIEKDTIYFDGQKKIENAIKKIRHDNPSFRIIVFIDDLDRCSPKKTLEVLESIKVFLGMEGFIYVIGVSHEIVTKLIDLEYKDTGIKGEHYIKKMIQIPIILPRWDSKDISNLITHFLDTDLINSSYEEVIQTNRKIISKAVEENPREIKRFLNSFIVSYEIFKKNEIDPKELLILQAIKLRWEGFYHLLVNNGQMLVEELSKYTQLSDEERLKVLDSNNEQENYNSQVKLWLLDFKSNDLWNFLKEHLNILSGIEQWSIYRRAVESTKIDFYNDPEISNSAIIGGKHRSYLKSISRLELPLESFNREVLIAYRNLQPQIRRISYLADLIQSGQSRDKILKARQEIEEFCESLDVILSTLYANDTTIKEVKYFRGFLQELKTFLSSI